MSIFLLFAILFSAESKNFGLSLAEIARLKHSQMLVSLQFSVDDKVMKSISAGQN